MTHLSQYSFTPAARRVAGMTREQACARMRPRVSSMARRVCGRRGQVGSLTVDDLASLGMEGLLAAFDHFDPARGTPFEAYARFRIKGAMIDALRAQDTMSRYSRGKARRFEQAARDAVRAGDGAVGAAGRMGLDLDAYWSGLREAQPVTVLSLDAPLVDGESDGATLLDVIADDHCVSPDWRMQHAEALALLRSAIDALPERLRQCVVLHYERGVAQTEIAKDLGITVSRVSQLLANARTQLRALLAPSVDGEDLV